MELEITMLTKISQTKERNIVYFLLHVKSKFKYIVKCIFVNIYSDTYKVRTARMRKEE